MHTLAIYCKTFSRDFKRLKKLFDSISKFNRDKIPFFISAPYAEKELLEKIIGTEGYNYIPDEEIYKVRPPFIGWKSQTPMKLNAYTKIPSKNILIIDSDGYFIRDFYLKDFIAYEDVPYTQMYENKYVAEMQKVLKGGSYQNNQYSKCMRAYRKIFGGKSNKIYDYGPNPHLWSTKVLKHLKENYLEPNGFTFETFSLAIEQNNPGIHSRETGTYGEYLLATKCIDIVPTGPFFKVYHWKEQWDFEQGSGLELEQNIKENYIGVIMQSNWNSI